MLNCFLWGRCIYNYIYACNIYIYVYMYICTFNKQKRLFQSEVLNVVWFQVISYYLLISAVCYPTFGVG